MPGSGRCPPTPRCSSCARLGSIDVHALEAERHDGSPQGRTENHAGFEVLEQDVPAKGEGRPVVAPLHVSRTRVQDLCQGKGAAKGIAEPFGGTGTDPAGGLFSISNTRYCRPISRASILPAGPAPMIAASCMAPSSRHFTMRVSRITVLASWCPYVVSSGADRRPC